VELPRDGGDSETFFAEMVERVIRAVERGQIPAAQYDAVLIDEGHDFRPEWLKLVVQMVDPRTNSLLVLYDDAQSIYGAGPDGKRRKFSFRSVGIQAVGRTTILQVNYRNTDAVLCFARDVARAVLKPEDSDEDSVPLLQPQPAGRAGTEPQVIRLPTRKDEADFVARRLKEAHRAGMPWCGMAVIYRDYHRDARLIRKVLPAHGVPLVYFEDATYATDEDKVTLITMHSCKGLEFPLVLIPGADHWPGAGELSPQEVRLLYVAMTRATNELVVCGAEAG
jgi:superfamily I DNA/RNA helicase